MPYGIKRALATICFTCLQAFSLTAQSATPLDWSMLVDEEAQYYEDPYRELSHQQMLDLMKLVRAKQSLQSDDIAPDAYKKVQAEIAVILGEFESEGLDADWILSQREVVAERRKRAALATAGELDGMEVELSGYILASGINDEGAQLAYLLPDRGLCMHLPQPTPNQVILLDLPRLPEPIGPCIASHVRGYLYVKESQHTVDLADGETGLWSRWELRVSAVSTTNALGR